MDYKAAKIIRFSVHVIFEVRGDVIDLCSIMKTKARVLKKSVRREKKLTYEEWEQERLRRLKKDEEADSQKKGRRRGKVAEVHGKAALYSTNGEK